MIEQKDVIAIGQFQKTHGLKGELNAIIEICPEYIENKNPLILEIDSILVPFYPESIRPKGVDSYLIKLEGIENQKEASELVNIQIFACRELIDKFMTDNDLILQEDLIGFKVVDSEMGELGIIERIDDSTDNVLLIVKNEDSELLIPFVGEFILEIDEENQVIEVDLPHGLINLN